MQLINSKLEDRLNSLVSSKKVSPETMEKVKREFFSKLDLNNPSQVQTVMITPDAAQVLLHLSNGNRDISPSYVTRFEQDIMNNQFHIGDSSWILDEDFTFTNGHHRAFAVISCQKGIVQGIRVGVEKVEAKLCDVGRNRNVLDTIVMTDAIKKSELYTKVNFSVARIVLTYGKSSYGISWTKISQSQLPAIIDQFSEEFEFFRNDFKDVIHSSISAVFLKAYPFFKAEGREQELKMALNAFKRGGDTGVFFEMQDIVPNKEALKTLIVLHKHATKRYTKERGGTVERFQFYRASNLLYSYFIGEIRSNDNTRENDEFPLRSEVRDYCLNLKSGLSDETSGHINFTFALHSILDTFPDGEFAFSQFVPELLAINSKLNISAIRKELNSLKKMAETQPLVIRNRQIRFVESNQPLPKYDAPKNGKFSWMNNSVIALSKKNAS